MPDTTPTTAPVAPLPAENQIEQFLERNFKTIMLAMVLLAVLLLGLGVKRYFSHQSDLEAAEKFTAANTIEDCDFVIQKYSGSLAAGNAILMKSELLWNQCKKESSIEALKTFAKDYKSHSLHPQMLLGLASKQAALGENDAVRQTCETLLKSYPQSEMAPAAQIQLGDLLWQEGKIDDAKKLYESLPRTYPGKMTTFSDSVDQRIQLMAAGLPMKEVDGPPAPPKPVSPAPGSEEELKKKIMDELNSKLKVPPTIEIKPTPGPEISPPPAPEPAPPP
ncbi:MAG: tetratricopeptide repeat protein, partial [Verrucomicrobiaceae bacterium]